MSAHTPGPWNDVHVQGEGVRIVATGPFAPIGQRLAWVPADDTEQLASGRVVERVSIEARANARLIAAAPDLLAALELIYHVMCNADVLDSGARRIAEAKARDAIAKARGGK